MTLDHVRHKTNAGWHPRRRSYGLMKPRKTVQLKSAWQKTLSGLKEWGGLATLLIAVLYTFPLGIWDRVTLNEEKLILQSRQVLADGGSMIIERLLNTAKISDPGAVEMIGNMYNMKFYNLLYSNRSLIESSKKYLRSSELATMAALLTFSGFNAEALSYYDDAIAKAREERTPYPNVLRDKAQVLLMSGPTRDLSSARDAYREVLGYVATVDHPIARKQFAIFLSELAYAEASIGDLKCGATLRAVAENELQLVRFTDSSVAPFHELFVKNMDLLKPSNSQTDVGCRYPVPEFGR